MGKLLPFLGKKLHTNVLTGEWRIYRNKPFPPRHGKEL
jgi:hypothetical protein